MDKENDSLALTAYKGQLYMLLRRLTDRFNAAKASERLTSFKNSRGANDLDSAKIEIEAYRQTPVQGVLNVHNKHSLLSIACDVFQTGIDFAKQAGSEIKSKAVEFKHSLAKAGKNYVAVALIAAMTAAGMFMAQPAQAAVHFERINTPAETYNIQTADMNKAEADLSKYIKHESSKINADINNMSIDDFLKLPQEKQNAVLKDTVNFIEREAARQHIKLDAEQLKNMDVHAVAAPQRYQSHAVAVERVSAREISEHNNLGKFLKHESTKTGVDLTDKNLTVDKFQDLSEETKDTIINDTAKFVQREAKRQGIKLDAEKIQETARAVRYTEEAYQDACEEYGRSVYNLSLLELESQSKPSSSALDAKFSDYEMSVKSSKNKLMEIGSAIDSMNVSKTADRILSEAKNSAKQDYERSQPSEMSI